MANTENCPKVGIVMGSDSDMPVMAKAADILEELGIPYEMTVISAHREPDVFFEYLIKLFRLHRTCTASWLTHQTAHSVLPFRAAQIFRPG